MNYSPYWDLAGDFEQAVRKGNWPPVNLSKKIKTDKL